MPEKDVFVDSNLLNEAMKRALEKKNALYLSAKLCQMIFTDEELALSDGFCLDNKKRDGAPLENPLDPIKANVIIGKEFESVLLVICLNLPCIETKSIAFILETDIYTHCTCVLKHVFFFNRYIT